MSGIIDLMSEDPCPKCKTLPTSRFLAFGMIHLECASNHQWSRTPRAYEAYPAAPQEAPTSPAEAPEPSRYPTETKNTSLGNVGAGFDICPECDDLAARAHFTMSRDGLTRDESPVMVLTCGVGHRWSRPATPDEASRHLDTKPATQGNVGAGFEKVMLGMPRPGTLNINAHIGQLRARLELLHGKPIVEETREQVCDVIECFLREVIGPASVTWESPGASDAIRAFRGRMEKRLSELEGALRRTEKASEDLRKERAETARTLAHLGAVEPRRWGG